MRADSLDEVWANLLKKLRDGKEYALFSLLSNCDDIEFTPNNIIIYVATEAEYNLLTKNVNKLDTNIIIREKRQKTHENQWTNALFDLLGNKLIIK